MGKMGKAGDNFAQKTARKKVIHKVDHIFLIIFVYGLRSHSLDVSLSLSVDEIRIDGDRPSYAVPPRRGDLYVSQFVWQSDVCAFRIRGEILT